jgi:hypothetical protein
MISGDGVDKLIRSTLRTEVSSQEPSAAVRDSLLAAAAEDSATRSALGPAIPPLVNGLRDANIQVEALQRWWETERLHLHHSDFSLWDNPWQTPGLVHTMLYHDARRYRFVRVTC